MGSGPWFDSAQSGKAVAGRDVEHDADWNIAGSLAGTLAMPNLIQATCRPGREDMKMPEPLFR